MNQTGLQNEYLLKFKRLEEFVFDQYSLKDSTDTETYLLSLQSTVYACHELCPSGQCTYCTVHSVSQQKQNQGFKQGDDSLPI